jgi:predicted CopG family antitoxin
LRCAMHLSRAGARLPAACISKRRLKNRGATPQINKYINVYIYVYIMSRLINVSDAIYEELTRIKRAKGQSYSEAIAGLMTKEGEKQGKAENWNGLLAKLRERSKAYAGKRVKIDHDLIAHGVSRDGA